MVGVRPRSCLGCWRNGFQRPVLKHGPRSLTCLRVFGWQTRARHESESWDPCRGEHRRPDQTFCDGSAVEHVCWDPKDGELCLNRVKPEETLVEARSDSDVQIDRQIWVWGRRVLEYKSILKGDSYWYSEGIKITVW